MMQPDVVKLEVVFIVFLLRFPDGIHEIISGKNQDAFLGIPTVSVVLDPDL
jgi:hypothetical protein